MTPLPATSWSGESSRVLEAFRFHLMTAEDKAIGYSSHYFPGLRGNIQKSNEKVAELVTITKIRLALRLAYSSRVHDMSPEELVSLGLIDPVQIFIKDEGHHGSKVDSQRWRLIWNVGEPDRIITAWIHSDQDHFDVATFQDDEEGRKSSLASGVGQAPLKTMAATVRTK